ncbi:MAG: TetR/AcrR family transcriptional regulator [Terracidiphilus sp.]
MQSLQIRKQQVVRDAIWDAAVGLFASKGFDSTTIEEISQAAGVSRRNFFRYFSSKDDLLVQTMAAYGKMLGEAVLGCPAGRPALEVMKAAVREVALEAVAHPRTKQFFEIAEQSVNARAALASASASVEQAVAKAFAARLPKDDFRAQLLSALTVSVLNAVISWWARHPRRGVSILVERACALLEDLH